jgi:hypothetical protein
MEWLYSGNQLRAMSDEELRALVVQTPLKNDYDLKERAYREKETELTNTENEKTRIYDLYKDALSEFKRVSLNPDGTKAKMTPEIRECRNVKEDYWRRLKVLKDQIKLQSSERMFLLSLYQDAKMHLDASMEGFVLRLLENSERQRRNILHVNEMREMELIRQRERRQRYRQERRLRELVDTRNFLINNMPLEERIIERARWEEEYQFFRNLRTEEVIDVFQRWYVDHLRSHGLLEHGLFPFNAPVPDRSRFEIKETIEQLSREELAKSMDDVCIICMETHNISDTLRTCCGHCFGKDCFQTWREQCETHNRCVNCPMCKNSAPSITKYAELSQPLDEPVVCSI